MPRKHKSVNDKAHLKSGIEVDLPEPSQEEIDAAEPIDVITVDCRTAHSPNRKPRQYVRRNNANSMTYAYWEQQKAKYEQRIADLEAIVAKGPDAHEGSLSIMRILHGNEEEVRKLLQACRKELEDPNEPGSYTLRQHADEAQVMYDVEVDGPRGGKTCAHRSETLQALLDASGVSGIATGEIVVRFRGADPRELLLKCIAALDDVAGRLLDVAKALTDSRYQELFTDAILEEIAKEEVGVAKRIAARVAGYLAGHTSTSDIAAGYIVGEEEDRE